MCIGFVSELVLPSPKFQEEDEYLIDSFVNSTLKSFLPVVVLAAENKAKGGDGETVT